MRQLPCQAGLYGAELAGSTRTESTLLAQLACICVFYEWSMKREKGLKNISSKIREWYLNKTRHPHAWLSGVSISHPRTWHWDPWLIGEAGLWKSRNLGIGFWQRVCWHSDTLLQLSWTRMKWVCYWGETLSHAHAYMHVYICICACMVCLHCPLTFQKTGSLVGQGTIYIFWGRILLQIITLIIWLGKINKVDVIVIVITLESAA